MSYFFSLQLKRCNRFLEEFGVTPVIGYILLLLLFVVMSFYVFYKSGNYADWIYLLLTVFIVEGFGAQQYRFAMLKSIFSRTDFIQIRLIENLLMVLPFSLFYVYQQSFLFALIVVIVGAVLAFIPQYKMSKIRMITPFKRQPFEFTSGFRKTILYFPMIMYVLIKSIQVDNGNLAVFTLGFLLLICLSYYFTNEPFYFTWIHNKKPKEFLLYKIKLALRNSTVLCMPILCITAIIFPHTWMALLLILILGYASIITLILAKYSTFPSSINLPQFLLFTLAIWFPPMLIVVLPIFYKRAIHNLKPLLS